MVNWFSFLKHWGLKILLVVIFLATTPPAWAQNTQWFSEPQKITQSTFFPKEAFSEDLDGDGDQDILVASSRDDKVFWYENTDGEGNFSLQKLIAKTSQGPEEVRTRDMDGDGDLDVVVFSTITISRDVFSKIAWYENINGLFEFGPEKIISTSSEKFELGDLDGDGDLDIVSLPYLNPKDVIGWYENIDGKGTFGSR